MTSERCRTYKGFANSVKQMLTQEYKSLGGDKIQDMFIHDLLIEFDKHHKDGWKLDASQVVWWAAHKDEVPGGGQDHREHLDGSCGSVHRQPGGSEAKT